MLRMCKNICQFKMTVKARHENGQALKSPDKAFLKCCILKMNMFILFKY